MNADDFAGTIEPKIVSKRAFWWLVCWWTVALFVLETIVALSLTIAFGVNLSAWLSGMGLPNAILANSLADATLKRRGLSRSGRTVERWIQVVGFRGSSDSVLAEVAIPYAATSHLIRSGVFGLIFLLPLDLLLAGFWIWMGHSPIGLIGWLAVPFLVVMTFLGVNLIVQGIWIKPMTRVDAEGITGHPMYFRIWPKFIPWSAISTCEIFIHRDTFGVTKVIVPRFRDAAGRRLITLDLSLTPMPDQERIAQAIRAHLPKPPRDA